MTTNQTARVLELLKRFNNGQKVCIEALQNDSLWYGKSEKTIRRDLDVIKEYFPDSFELIRGSKGEKGCYKAITKDSFEKFMSPDTLSLMIQTFNIAARSDLFDSFDISDVDKRILNNKVNQVNKIYEFKNKPLETKKDDMEIFKKLETSIKYQKVILIEYQKGDTKLKYEVKPYKIIFINENFYLACESDSEFIFSIFRISNIKSILNTSKTFHKSPNIESFIKHMQTPFARYDIDFKSKLIDVVLEVDKSKAYFFKVKKFLSTQNIEDEKENGNIVVSYKVTQELEVDELIKKWIPYVKVIEPISLKERIENELRDYLS